MDPRLLKTARRLYASLAFTAALLYSALAHTQPSDPSATSEAPQDFLYCQAVPNPRDQFGPFESVSGQRLLIDLHQSRRAGSSRASQRYFLRREGYSYTFTLTVVQGEQATLSLVIEQGIERDRHMIGGSATPFHFRVPETVRDTIERRVAAPNAQIAGVRVRCRRISDAPSSSSTGTIELFEPRPNPPAPPARQQRRVRRRHR